MCTLLLLVDHSWFKIKLSLYVKQACSELGEYIYISWQQLSAKVCCRGVNMFAMLTGTLPFTVEPFHVKALYNKMVAGDMNPLPAYLSRGISCLQYKSRGSI